VGLTQGASVVNASAEDLNFVGSNNGTTLFVEAASLAQGDVLNGGAGAGGNLVLTGAARLANTSSTAVNGNNSAFAATGFETLTITDTAGNGVGLRDANNPAAFNLANVSGVNTVQLGTASGTVVGLTNLQYTSPLAINVTGNGESTVNAGNGVNAVFFGAFGDADTVNYTFGNRGRALNSNNTLTLGQLSLPNIENLNLTFNDLSSNTTLLYNAFGSNAGTANALFANSSSARFVTVNSQSGDSDANAINLGIIGGLDTVRGGVVNSNAGVTARFNNRGGASFEVAGAGDHTLSVTNLTAAEDSTINAGTATGDLTLSVNDATRAGRALFTGGSGDDTVSGGAGADVLTGNSGDDILRGKDGVDVISGGDNNDTLIGGLGVVVGGNSIANDVLTGGGGLDVFAYTQNNESLTTQNATAVVLAEGSDFITDFNRAQDTFAFRAFGNGGGNITFQQNVATLASAYDSNRATIVTLNAAGTQGAAPEAGNPALLIFNTTNATINVANNNLSATGLGATAGLQIVQLGAQPGVNYGLIDASDFAITTLTA